jgi:hypothetical protein
MLLKTFKNRIVRIVFRLKSDKLKGNSRKLRTEELHKYYPSEMLEDLSQSE